MTVTDAAILGAIQGLTEFLPVSSSGHLTLGQALLGWSEPNLLFDIVVHVGTLVAVVGVYRDDVLRAILGTLRALGVAGGGGGGEGGAAPDDGGVGGGIVARFRSDPDAWRALLVVVATVPTGVVGLMLGKRLSMVTSSPRAVGLVLLANGALLLATRWMVTRPGIDGGARTDGDARRDLLRALLIGLGQGFAVLRGLSRSGTTIALGLFTKLDRGEAARFSFLLSIPAILGALVLEFDVQALRASGGVTPYAVGFVVSAGVGWAALKALLAVVHRGGLHWFAAYCWVVGAVALFAGGGAG